MICPNCGTLIPDGTNTWGARMLHIRQEAGISLRKLAAAVDLSPKYVWDIERGNRNTPSQEYVREWEQFLGVEASDETEGRSMDRDPK